MLFNLTQAKMNSREIEMLKNHLWAEYLASKKEPAFKYQFANYLVKKIIEEQETIEKAITEVDGFGNWLMKNRYGYTQAEIDKSVKEGVRKVDALIREAKKKLKD